MSGRSVFVNTGGGDWGIIIVFGLIILIGTGVLIAWLINPNIFKSEGDECEIEDGDTKGNYKVNNKKECVLTSCKSGWDMSGDTCVKEKITPTTTNSSIPNDDPSIAAQLREPGYGARGGGNDRSRPSINPDDNCVVRYIGYGNHKYIDGKLYRPIDTFLADDVDGCRSILDIGIFGSSEAAENKLNAYGYKINVPDEYKTEFDISGPTNMSYNDLNQYYVRCNSRTGFTDGSCVDSTNNFSTGGVAADSEDACQTKCNALTKCVAYSYKNSTKDCRLSGVDTKYNIGGRYLLTKGATPHDQGFITKSKVLHGIQVGRRGG
jgi:hypothetical protein|tara:strand:+ start:196 stop:1158 length:963 start_codon:yes stop_codon:yes gene_type:complete